MAITEFGEVQGQRRFKATISTGAMSGEYPINIIATLDGDSVDNPSLPGNEEAFQDFVNFINSSGVYSISEYGAMMYKTTQYRVTPDDDPMS